MAAPLAIAVAGFIARHGVAVLADRDRNTYWADTDTIEVKHVSEFSSPRARAGTLAHELGHWTGHKSRMDRAINRTKRHEASYAAEKWREEMVAEAFARLFLARAGEPELRAEQWDTLKSKCPPELTLEAEIQATMDQGREAFNRYANTEEN